MVALLDPDFDTCRAIGAIEDQLNSLDLDAVEALIARNEASVPGVAAVDAHDDVFFRHVIERQQLVLRFAREWRTLIAAAPPTPKSLNQLKELLALGLSKPL